MLSGLWNRKATEEGAEAAKTEAEHRQRQIDINYANIQLEKGYLSCVLGSAAAGQPGREGPATILSLHDVSLLKPDASQGSILKTCAGMAVKTLRHCWRRYCLYCYSYIAAGRGDTARPEASDEQDLPREQVDRGTLSVTTKGIVFTGHAQTISVDFRYVELAERTPAGIVIARKDSGQRLHFGGLERTLIQFQVQDRVYSQPASGRLVGFVVEAAMRVEPDAKARG